MRLLLVEDDVRIASKVKAVLEDAGYAVDLVADGEVAWFQGDTEDYDLAVLDLGLPKMDGLSVLKKWRAAGRDFPVLILTARGRLGGARRGHRRWRRRLSREALCHGGVAGPRPRPPAPLRRAGEPGPGDRAPSPSIRAGCGSRSRMSRSPFRRSNIVV